MTNRTYDALLRGCRFSTQIGSFAKRKLGTTRRAKSEQKLVDIEVQTHAETARALRVSVDGEIENSVWLPKSLIEFDRVPGSRTLARVTLPEWKALQHGLV